MVMGSMKKLTTLIVIELMMMIVCRVEGDYSLSECMRERQQTMDFCAPIIFGQPPSALCCQRLRANQLECICPAFSAKIGVLIDVNLAIYLFKTCGRRVPRHFKCGTLLFP